MACCSITLLSTRLLISLARTISTVTNTSASAIRKLLERSKPVDVVTVAESLDLAGEGGETGGLAYLGELAANTPSAANIRRYAEIVRERAILRQLVTAGDEIAGSAFNPLGRGQTLLDEARQCSPLPRVVSAVRRVFSTSTHCLRRWSNGFRNYTTESVRHHRCAHRLPRPRFNDIGTTTGRSLIAVVRRWVKPRLP